MINFYDSFERNVLIGRSSLQRFFESLHRFSLRGMNYDQVSTPKSSGELYVLKYLQNKLPRQSKLTLFDVGANVGEYAKLLCQYFPQSRVFGFEALPATYEILLQNIKRDDQIFPVNKALGSTKEKRSFYTDGAGSGLSTFFPMESITSQHIMQEITIEIETIDSFCLDNQIEKIDFLKIDVEGFELEVLKGAKKMIADKRIQAIQFEFGKNHIKSGTHFYDFFEYLSEYKISRVLKDGLRPYKTYEAQHEIYLGANYFAELKN